MIVMKFGGTSVGSREAVERTVGIVRGRLQERPVVVVSAMSKVTDMLYAISDALEAGDKDAADLAFAELRQKHLETAAALLPSDPIWREEAYSRISDICDSLQNFADEVIGGHLEMDKRRKAIIDSKGEYLSSNMICCYMNSVGIRTEWVDAREFMLTDNDYLQGIPDMHEIERRCPKVIDAAFAAAEAVITQGFVCKTADGSEGVLGRGGSDYSASIIGMAIDASRIEIWTDVDGVQSADPRKVSNTRRISRISFEEAAEMAAYGAKVLHPKTIEPAVSKNIPVMVLNSMNPDGQGTVILQSAFIEDGVRSVSSKENIRLVRVSQPVMTAVSELLTATFAALAESRVKVDLVKVTPRELLFTTDSTDYIAAAAQRISAFAKVSVEDGYAQISVIGKNISELKLALKAASAQLRNSPLASVAQNDSYVNISFVVPRAGVREDVQKIHTYLFGREER